MNTQSAQPVSSAQLGELIDRLFKQSENGEPIDLTQLLQEYPEFSEQLRRVVPMLCELSAMDWRGEGRPISFDDQLGTAEQGTIGDFRILRQIGRGGMGIVFEAQQLTINRKVALKILPLAALVDPRALQRFKNEVTAIATLQHPHIVAVYSIGEERGIHYFAMQLIRGQSLAAVIRELRARSDQDQRINGDALNQAVSVIEKQESGQAASGSKDSRSQEVGDLDETKAETVARGRSSTVRNVGDPTYFRNVARLIQQAAEALQHAHDHGIVHRDIKPGNLLLDSHGTLFVTDFGLARIETGAGVTMTGDVLGTLRYMSPEQVLGNRVVVDHRTDIYSLGATLYELLTLQPIWQGDDKAGLIRQISFEEPTRPQKINSSIPTDLETIALKAINKNPNERYGTAQLFADDLNAFVELKPIRARRPTVVQRIAKFGRRNPRLVVAVMVALVLATAGSIVSNILILEQKYIADEKTKEANQSKNLADDRAASEKLARVNAEQLSKQTGEYNEILAGIFEDFDPRMRQPTDPPLETLLGKRLIEAGRKIGAGEYAKPGYQVNLLLRLGSTLLNLGFPNDALELYRRAEEIVVENAPNNEERWVALTSNYLGRAFAAVGKPELAIDAYQRSYDVYRESEDELVNTLSSLHGLAVAQLSVGRYRDAIANLELVVPQRIDLHGETHRATLTSMSVLATAYQRDGQLDKALYSMEKVFELRRKTFGDEAVDTNTTRSNLATLKMAMGDDFGAYELLDQAVAAMKKSLGDDHPNTNVMLTNLAVALLNIGKTDDALPHIERAAANLTARLGAEHEYTLKAQAVKASLLLDQNDTTGALAFLQPSFDAGKANGPELTPVVLDLGVRLVGALGLAGEFEKAAEVGQEILKQAVSQLGETHSTTTQVRLVMARSKILSGVHLQAIEDLKAALELQAPGGDSWNKDHFLLSSELAGANLLVGNYREAVEMFTSLLKSRERLTDAHPLIQQSLADLALSLAMQKQWNEARQANDDLLNQLAGAQQSGWMFGRVKLQQAILQMRTGQVDQAKSNLAVGIERIVANNNRLNAFARLSLRLVVGELKSAFAASDGIADSAELLESLDQLAAALN